MASIQRALSLIPPLLSLVACDADMGNAPPITPIGSHARLAETFTTAGVAPLDIGTLGGPFSTAYAINTHGVIVGTSSLPDGSIHMFVRDTDGVMHDAGSPSFTHSVQPRAVNDDGVVVGTTGLPPLAFRWTRAGGFRALDLPPGASEAWDINNRGEVVGAWTPADGSGRRYAFVWRGDTGVRFLTHPHASRTHAWAINDRGVVVGTFDSAGVRRAFRWTPGTGVRDVGAPGYSNSASDINNRGVIVGTFATPTDSGRGFRIDEPWRGIDLGTYNDGELLSPLAIADDGTIVALAIDRRGRFVAIRQRGTQQEELLPLTLGAAVRDVNACGRAVGESVLPNGMPRAVLWPGWC